MGFFEKMKAGLARTRSQMAATINTMIADFTEENEEIYDSPAEPRDTCPLICLILAS